MRSVGLKQTLVLLSGGVMMALASGICSASEDTPSIHCQGTAQDVHGKPIRVVVATNPAQHTLDLTRFPTTRPANRFDTQSYPITNVNPMFPIYSVVAEKDQRPVDGSYNKLTLTINTESLSTTGPGHSGRLLHEQETLRGGHSEKTYILTCTIDPS